jgi:hypothetical protein
MYTDTPKWWGKEHAYYYVDNIKETCCDRQFTVRTRWTVPFNITIRNISQPQQSGG